MDALTRLVHLVALAVYLGGTVALVLVLLPAASALEDPALRRRVLARGLRPYNVLSVGALGVLILTGASSLTEWKRTLGPAYGRLLWPLVGKLSLTFALTMVGTWLSFGIAHRLVRAELGGLPVEPQREQSMVKRLAAGAWLAIALAVWTTWVGLSLAGVGR
jgi:uncharacterized membrane protein